MKRSCRRVAVSSRGQDTWFSATGPGFESPYRYQKSIPRNPRLGSHRLGAHGIRHRPRRSPGQYLATDRDWADRPGPTRARLSTINRPRELVGSVCTCELLMGASARYACSQEHDHECKPSPHRHTSASTSDEKAEEAARADCRGTGDRSSCARSQVAANLLTIPHDDEGEATSSARLAWPGLAGGGVSSSVVPHPIELGSMMRPLGRSPSR